MGISDNEMIDGKIVPKKKKPFINKSITLAMEIAHWYWQISRLPLQDKSNATMADMTAEVKSCSESVLRHAGGGELDTLTLNKRIFAVWAICEAFSAIESIGRMTDTKNVQQKVKTAELFLKYAYGIENLKQAKTPRGKKQHYANPGEFEQFLMNINKRFKGKSLKIRVNVAISEMKGRRLFLDEKGKPLYAETTIRRMLSEVEKRTPYFSNSKVTEK